MEAHRGEMIAESRYMSQITKIQRITSSPKNYASAVIEADPRRIPSTLANLLEVLRHLQRRLFQILALLAFALPKKLTRKLPVVATFLHLARLFLIFAPTSAKFTNASTYESRFVTNLSRICAGRSLTFFSDDAADKPHTLL